MWVCVRVCVCVCVCVCECVCVRVWLFIYLTHSLSARYDRKAIFKRLNLIKIQFYFFKTGCRTKTKESIVS